MGKMVGVAKFKANRTRLLRKLGEDGEAITVTSRAKPVAVVSAPESKPNRPSALGMMKGQITIRGDLDDRIGPDWEKKWLTDWNEQMRDVER